MPVSFIEFFVEERSAEAALQELVPKICPGLEFQIHVYQGKKDLLGKLPDRLRGLSRWLPASHRIVILLDRDAEDCKRLKRQLERLAGKSGLRPKSGGSASNFQVLIRIAIEELEAWYFGDVEALCAAYPGVPRTLGTHRRYRDPDRIEGGTWEALERVLNEAGHYTAGLAKIEAAREIASRMVPARNRSRSFQTFAAGLASL